MFICTMKFNKKTAIGILIAIAVLLCSIVIGVRVLHTPDNPLKSNLSKGIKTNEDRIAYLADLGWECEDEVVEEQKIIIPREFNNVFLEYNELQKQQGFDLSNFCGLEVTMYRYKVNNYPSSEDTVMAQLIILNYEVIGGDIHSTSMDGFMHGLK